KCRAGGLKVNPRFFGKEIPPFDLCFVTLKEGLCPPAAWAPPALLLSSSVIWCKHRDDSTGTDYGIDRLDQRTLLISILDIISNRKGRNEN
ncbi:MAG TPA: hypothetical protein PLG61_06980, partial [Methanoregulaceae archaeon]|nr:hypothetical protein [Methanoregulaceae archaeon]HPJ74666.1 hypothetical protein [Methanoregulaceae archaeon]